MTALHLVSEIQSVFSYSRSATDHQRKVKDEAKTSFYCDAIVAAGRAPEIPAEDDIYGWLVGSWDQELTVYDPDGSVRRSTGEAHFSWGLEGRAIVDVWINPHRKDRLSVPSRFADWYGTTLRIYDPALRAWRITWRDPSRGVFMDQIAYRVGENIVQEGKGPDGATYRWTFKEITAGSFHWTAEMQPPNQTIWTLQVDIHSRRVSKTKSSVVGKSC